MTEESHSVGFSSPSLRAVSPPAWHNPEDLADNWCGRAHKEPRKGEGYSQEDMR